MLPKIDKTFQFKGPNGNILMDIVQMYRTYDKVAAKLSDDLLLPQIAKDLVRFRWREIRAILTGGIMDPALPPSNRFIPWKAVEPDTKKFDNYLRSNFNLPKEQWL